MEESGFFAKKADHWRGKGEVFYPPKKIEWQTMAAVCEWICTKKDVKALGIRAEDLYIAARLLEMSALKVSVERMSFCSRLFAEKVCGVVDREKQKRESRRLVDLRSGAEGRAIDRSTIFHLECPHQNQKGAEVRGVSDGRPQAPRLHRRNH